MHTGWRPDRRDPYPVALIQGMPSHAYIWRNVAPRFVAAGYRVFKDDLPGFGASERPLSADTSVGGQGPVLEAVAENVIRFVQGTNG